MSYNVENEPFPLGVLDSLAFIDASTAFGQDTERVAVVKKSIEQAKFEAPDKIDI